MLTIKYIFNAINYVFFVFYSYTLIDVVKKVSFGEFYLSNANNFLQFILTLIGIFYAYYRLKTYIRDSRTRSELLEQELLEKQNAHFYKKWTHEFLEPKPNDKPTDKI